jgi:DMATS type aromatic prenyltransferase
MTSARFSPFNEAARAQLSALWRAIHLDEVPRSVLDVVDTLVPPTMGTVSFGSSISDDHTPYELSLLLGRSSTEIRLMSELAPPGREGSLSDTVTLGREALLRLAERHDVDLSRLDAIAPGLLDAPRGAFALWLASSFDRDGTPSFKVYLNPMADGVARAPAVLEAALSTLGMSGAWATATRAFSRGPTKDELRFLSLDLARSRDARVKLYAFHHDATPDDLVRVAGVVPNVDRGRVLEFVRTMLDGDGVARAARQPATCLAFVAGSALPRTGTVHIPVRTFAGDDRAAHRRIVTALQALDVPATSYLRAVESLASRPLESGSGLLAWAALRFGEASPRVNVYLAPRVLADAATHPKVAPSIDRDDPGALVADADAHPITDHPYWQRLAREPLDLRSVALFLLNIRVAITRGFARRLASVVARVEEDDVRSILAKQLDDELGHGDPERAHRLLFERFVEGLLPWAPEEGDPGQLAPGHALLAAQEDLYLSRSAYEGVGATLLMEVFGRQADQFLGQVLRRSGKELPERVTEWLTLHEELENEHAGESYELARRLPRGPKSRLAARGADEVHAACWAFLDDLYRVAYGS